MNLAELFQQSGFGVMSTAGADGSVNSAVYARPHVVDATTLVWGMTQGRTFRNVRENPQAAFLFRTAEPGFQGVRLRLQLLKSEEAGEVLEAIRRNTDRVVAPGAGLAVTHAVWFKVEEVRPLI